jgi:hypothetical protein
MASGRDNHQLQRFLWRPWPFCRSAHPNSAIDELNPGSFKRRDHRFEGPPLGPCQATFKICDCLLGYAAFFH